VADDDARAVDAPGDVALLAHDCLGVVLGAEVGVVELLGLLEHVLAERAVVEARGGDRARVVEAAGPDRLGELDRVARAVDVGGLLALGIGGEVVDRGEVEAVLHLALELRQVGGGNAQLRLREVAHDRDDALRVLAPARPQLVELPDRALAHQHVDVAFALDEPVDEETADEAGPSGHEVGHGVSSGAAYRLAEL
jgi:hypothetical protein